MLPFSRTHCARLKNSDMTRRGIHLSVTCTYSTVQYPILIIILRKQISIRKTNFHFPFLKLAIRSSIQNSQMKHQKKIEFWNNFSRELRKKKKRENITHQQQKQQISVEISISFPSTQIALHKRKAEIKCLFLIVSLCFLLHFFCFSENLFLWLSLFCSTAAFLSAYGHVVCFWCVWNRRNINFFCTANI